MLDLTLVFTELPQIWVFTFLFQQFHFQAVFWILSSGEISFQWQWLWVSIILWLQESGFDGFQVCKSSWQLTFPGLNYDTKIIHLSCFSKIMIRCVSWKHHKTLCKAQKHGSFSKFAERDTPIYCCTTYWPQGGSQVGNGHYIHFFDEKLVSTKILLNFHNI